MNHYILIAGVFALLPLQAQFINDTDKFQTLTNLSTARVLDEGFGNRVVKGKPFSATEERHSLQVLGDGTRIENNQTNRLYRDTEGRTRVEEMNGTINIYDPAAKLRVELDPATKTARKGNANRTFYFANGWSTFGDGPFVSIVNSGQNTPPNPATMQGVMTETTENLGPQTVNGITAQGVRNTMIIPKGQIGNNKDIKIMTERWSSNDLQMLVKSINNDPRFGDTTYQLTKITQSAPDPALFQIPPDYTVSQLPGAARLKLDSANGLGQFGGYVAPPTPAPARAK